MKANQLPIIKSKRKDCTIAERVFCPRLGKVVSIENCIKCKHLHFSVTRDFVKCAFGQEREYVKSYDTDKI